MVVGGGNSGAQIAADLAYDTQLTWVTQRPPRLLADDIDGRALFDVATALPHLAPLQLRGERRRIATTGTRAVDEPCLHLLGYEDWTGPASATLIGVGRSAREAAGLLA